MPATEFASFVRDAGIRAVDRVSEETKELAAPLRTVLRAWSKLTDELKHELFDRLISTAQGEPEQPKKRGAKKASSTRKASGTKKTAAKKR